MERSDIGGNADEEKRHLHRRSRPFDAVQGTAERINALPTVVDKSAVKEPPLCKGRWHLRSK